MKARKGFVSNSSSSSFLVWGDRRGQNFKGGEVPEEICLLIDDDLAEILFGDDANIWDDIKGSVYLTPFLSDGGPFTQPLEEAGVIYHEYASGNHGGPYDEEEFVSIGDVDGEKVWVKKEHYKLLESRRKANVRKPKRSRR